ncbi:MAG TPA: agmatinase, partial [Actinomycetota bacterium]|nr:agmatinase [Actinomycetota bacterium]
GIPDGARFLAADASYEEAVAVIQGLPWDGSVSWRAGARDAPSAVRIASDSIETYSPVLRADLEDHAIFDAGDLALAGKAPEDAIDLIAAETERHLRAGKFLISVGGDHSVSIGTTRGARRVHPGLVHLVYDAHMDMRASYDGTDLSHACGTRHMAMAGTTIALGIRSGAREEFTDADKMLAYWSTEVEIVPQVRSLLQGRPVFVSCDLDVLDPGQLPGTGTPEPGGCSYKELRASLLSLQGLNVVGVDLVEVSPNWDPSGRSPVVAAQLSREIFLGLGVVKILSDQGK